MTAADVPSVSVPFSHEMEDAVPTTLRVGLVSAGSVILSIAVVAAGLLAMVTVNLLAGALILLGAIPLWGWACVHNKTLYSQ